MQTLRKRILLLITNLGKGGAQKVFYDHALALSGMYEVAEAVFDINEDERLYNSGLKLTGLSDIAGVSSALPGPLGRLQHRARALKALVQQQQPSVVISHMDGANWVNALSRSAAAKILVVHGTVLHDHDQSSIMQWLRRRVIIPYLYNKADVTVAVSEGIAHELKTYCGVRNAISIPNFFDIASITEKAAEPLPAKYASLFADHEVCITSGRLHEQKKQRSLFPVFRQVKERRPGARLVILGDGELRNGLVGEATAQGLTVYNSLDAAQPYHDRYDVYFPGYVSNPYQYLRHSKVFLFPSGWEGFPMALCEAMISGVPVITADCPTGPRQILAPGTYDHHYGLQHAEVTPNGYLMPMENKPDFTSEWARITLQLLDDTDARQAIIAAAQDRMQAFDKDEVLKRWQDLIETYGRT